MSSFRESINGGSFYVDANETVMDPFLPVATVQTQLTVELQRYDDLVQRDYRYARIVAGASKMAMGMIWASRGEDAVSDTDLAAFKDAAWNEFIKKRYLPSLPGTTSVQTAAASMLEIVRDMNLQHRRFAVMGLHEQVEASEIQLVLHLCQADVIRGNNYRAMANRYRRHDQLFEAFGLAVGAFVCSSAPYTLGSGTGRYERDLQFEYKKQTTALFVWALRKVQDFNGLDDDYVARLSRLIVVRPGGDRRVGFRGSDGGGGNDDDKKNNQVLLDAVVEAQRNAEAALVKSIETNKDVESLRRDAEAAKETLEKEMEREVEKLATGIANDKNLMDAKLQAWKHETVATILAGGKENLEMQSKEIMARVMDKVDIQVNAKITESKVLSDAQTEESIKQMKDEAERILRATKEELSQSSNDRLTVLEKDMQDKMNAVITQCDEHTAKLNKQSIHLENLLTQLDLKFATKLKDATDAMALAAQQNITANANASAAELANLTTAANAEIQRAGTAIQTGVDQRIATALNSVEIRSAIEASVTSAIAAYGAGIKAQCDTLQAGLVGLGNQLTASEQDHIQKHQTVMAELETQSARNEQVDEALSRTEAAIQHVREDVDDIMEQDTQPPAALPMDQATVELTVKRFFEQRAAVIMSDQAVKMHIASVVETVVRHYSEGIRVSLGDPTSQFGVFTDFDVRIKNMERQIGIVPDDENSVYEPTTPSRRGSFKRRRDGDDDGNTPRSSRAGTPRPSTPGAR